MVVVAQRLIGDNAHIMNIFLNEDLARNGEAEWIEG
jgi:hypothetical protein